MKNIQALKSLNATYTGTESYHRWSVLFPNIVLSDGAKALAEAGECYWLMDLIASHQPDAKKDPMLQQMQFWHLCPGKAPTKQALEETSQGVITYMKSPEGPASCYARCDRDSDDTAIVQEIPYTDFPFKEAGMDDVSLYCGPGECGGKRVQVIYLPSEY